MHVGAHEWPVRGMPRPRAPLPWALQLWAHEAGQEEPPGEAPEMGRRVPGRVQVPFPLPGGQDPRKGQRVPQRWVP